MSATLLSIEKLSSDNLPFPAYFVASTAPINIEDQQGDRFLSAKGLINEIVQHLQTHKGNAEILIVVHGYNTSKIGVKKWFESIARHLASHHSQSRSPGFMLIGYRWPSEQIFPRGKDIQEEGGSFLDKRQSANQALPVILGRIFRGGSIGLGLGIIGSVVSGGAIAIGASKSILMLIIFFLLTMFSGAAISPIVTLIALRVVGYFRDNYRATNFGIADLVELIRQIDNALIKASPGENRATKKDYWEKNRIKLSFIGHSMGGFVVTNTVRILSDVFDPRSIGSIDAHEPEKNPSSAIGNVFSLGRLVLVAPDIPAETIISGRANFLQSSLRRFEEAYLFSNEGDMALRLASTAANYFSYPTKTQDGGYRLGNVTVRYSTKAKKSLQQSAASWSASYGMMVKRLDGQLVSLFNGQEINIPGMPLDYLYIREQKPLSQRQGAIALELEQKPIGELFTFFDCTDYSEAYKNFKGQQKTQGLLSHALRKQALSFKDYVFLTIDFFSGKIDTHGGYFSDGKSSPNQKLKPEATFTKLAIYGLATIGYEKFLLDLSTELVQEPIFRDPNKSASYAQILQEVQSRTSELTAHQQEKLALSQVLSSLCRERGIQVLLAQKRHTMDVLERDRKNSPSQP
jgi:pimeloyl-ACP methyl ester carboxylesterase